MNTINKLNAMKKSLVVLALAILLMPLTAMAQTDIFEKYSNSDNVTYASIKPKMFQMLAGIDIETDSKEAQEYMKMVKSITSFKTLATDDKNVAGDIAKWVKARSGSLEELMEIKDDGVVVKFYVKEGRDENFVAELLMFVNGLDAVTKDLDVNVNGKKRGMESVLVSFTGDIDLNQLSKLINAFDLPGGKELDKKKK
ncbi:uncharacterized protein DUF4252 [Lacinutrix venerupis]|uniref:DUF4252 domain-containing protein n=1 Tax=Lacinutrix venerupis TaxID=1486034 RepID=UPI000EABF0D5|nr:DUF4252 domain-containing protein [Lacinutrix venerupis]RLJ62510.1 uncharacterized protein DUF4252 [Lacinutrix venerupis]